MKKPHRTIKIQFNKEGEPNFAYVWGIPEDEWKGLTREKMIKEAHECMDAFLRGVRL